jgi:hypothetical protein
MAKKIEFVFDFESKDVQIASERTLSLAQQVKVLKQELQKTKEGTAEFDILRNKLNDTQDSFERVNSKTQDLFGTLSLIPGPIGDIAGKLNGTVSLFKTFSNFSFKDLKTQFIDIIDDLGGIIKNIGKLTGITAVYSKVNEVLAASFVKVGIGEQAAAVGARAFAAALTATGVGAIVVALGFAVSALMEYANAADDAAEKQKELNEQQIAGVKAANTAVIKFYKQEEEIEILRAKKAGKSEEELQKIREKYAKKRITTQQNTLSDLQRIQGADTNAQAEAVADAQDELTKIELEGQIERNRKSKEAAAKRKQERQKEREENKQLALDDIEAQIQILREGENTNVEALRKALKKQFDLRNEGKKVTANILQAQQLEIDKKVQEELDKDKKANEDRAKQRQEFLDKIRQIQIAGIADETQREEAQRIDKFEKEKKALEEDTEFKKLNKIAQAAILLQLQQTLDNDLETIRKKNTEKEKNDRLKSLDDQLKFLDLQFQSVSKFSEEYFNLRQEQLRIQQQRELEGVEKGSKEEFAILQKYSNLKKQLKDEELQATGQVISATLDSFASLGNAIASTYDEEAKTSEEAFNKRKKLQKATAVISAASGIVQILTQPSVLPSPVDFIVKGVNAAALGIATAVQISKINATQFQAPDSGSNQQPRKLASGGIVEGPGGPKDDKVPTLLSNGESVINARSTELFRPLLSTINQIGGGRKFANGGVVSTNYTQQQALNEVNSTLGDQSMRPIKTYVVATDMTSQQQFDRAQKSRSTL